MMITLITGCSSLTVVSGGIEGSGAGKPGVPVNSGGPVEENDSLVGWAIFESEEFNFRLYHPVEWEYEIYEESGDVYVTMAFNDQRAEDMSTDRPENIGTLMSLTVMNRENYQLYLEEQQASPGREGIMSYERAVDVRSQDVVYLLYVNDARFITAEDQQQHLAVVDQIYRSFELLEPEKKWRFPRYDPDNEFVKKQFYITDRVGNNLYNMEDSQYHLTDEVEINLEYMGDVVEVNLFAAPMGTEDAELIGFQDMEAGVESVSFTWRNTGIQSGYIYARCVLKNGKTTDTEYLYFVQDE
jgi:hypothetical protein